MKKNTKGVLVGWVRSKSQKDRLYEVRKLGVGNWFCSCGMNVSFPCAHKRAVWSKDPNKAIMVEADALKRGWMPKRATA